MQAVLIYFTILGSASALTTRSTSAGTSSALTIPNITIKGKSSAFTIPNIPTKCGRFVVLTRARSGSTWFMQQLNNTPNFHVAWEALNMRSSAQDGRKMAEALGYTVDEAMAMGTKQWAEKVFDALEEDLQPPCHVGFKMMGKGGDSFLHADAKPLLQDGTVKKLLLRRVNRSAHWISTQAACWYADWSKSRNSDHEEIWKQTEDRMLRGETCRADTYEEWSTMEDENWETWNKWLDNTLQSRFALRTEGLNDQLPDAIAFLKADDSVKTKVHMKFDVFDILRDDLTESRL